jgi:hypothetical protein
MVALPAKPEVGEGGLNECQCAAAHAWGIKCQQDTKVRAALSSGVIRSDDGHRGRDLRFASRQGIDGACARG